MVTKAQGKTGVRRRRRRRRPQRQRYVTSLDGLRALCALGVIGYHMRLPWLGGGLLGVTILFVLSGYLVTAGLLREFATSRGHIDLRSFWTKRFWRLMPTVFVVTAVTGALCFFFDHALLTKMRPDIIPGVLMFINWSKILANESYFAAAGNPSPLTHYWSLAIEAQFYLLWPPILYLLMRKRVPRKGVRVGLLVATLVSAGLMALLYVPGADPSRSYYGTDTRAFSLLLGCWLAIIWPFDRMSVRKASRLKGARRIVAQVVGPLSVIALIAMMVLTEGYSSFSYYGGILLCSVLAVGAIAGLVPDGTPLSKVLSLPPLVWIGKRSYAIYLWHYVILELMNPLNVTTGTPWWKLLLELVLILAISELSYRFVEVPLRNVGKRDAKQAESTDKSARSRRQPSRQDAGKTSTPAPAMAGVLAFAPALVVTLLAGAIMAYGLVTVKPVTAGGTNPDDRVVMQASLKKPLQDGVYDVVLIGDSVSLGANEQLNAAFPHGLIDTKGSRQAPEALESLQGYVSQGVVGDDVVWSIGTNGILDHDLMDSLLETVGAERRLWLVNLRTPNAKDVDNNALIDEYVANNDNVYLVDWLGSSVGHDDWFGPDGIHLTWDGRDAYAALVVDTMGYELPDESNTTYNVIVMGDSVCLDAADALATAFPKGLVDTADGRSPADLAKAYSGYADQGVVGNVVVVAVGNEELLTRADLDGIVNAVGPDKTLYLVNVRMPGSWGTSNDELIGKVADEQENVLLIDWYGASEGHDGWFVEDGAHLSDDGAAAYANLISSEVQIPEAMESTVDQEGADTEGESEDATTDDDASAMLADESAGEASSETAAEAYETTSTGNIFGSSGDAYATDTGYGITGEAQADTTAYETGEVSEGLEPSTGNIFVNTANPGYATMGYNTTGYENTGGFADTTTTTDTTGTYGSTTTDTTGA